MSNVPDLDDEQEILSEEMVAEDTESQAHQDRSQGDPSFSVHHLSDVRSGCVEGTFS
jgi:hypothetical protein